MRFHFHRLDRATQTLALACILFWSVLMFLGVRRWVFLVCEVEGDSMLPTLQDGDREFVHRWIYLVRRPQRGDVVAVNLPDDDDLSVKRIVALPNESVQIHDGRVWVNDRPLAEPYLSPQGHTHSGALRNRACRVAKDCYFVLGDNRDVSLDSRAVGAVPRAQIIGRIFVD